MKSLPTTEPLVLSLSSDDPAHTTLTSTNTPLYRTETDYHSGKHPITTLHNHAGQAIASLERHEVLSDVVTLLGDECLGKPMKLTKWMKPGLVRRSTCTFQDQHGRKYEWRGYAIGKALRLYAADTPAHPIAYFTRRARRLTLSTSATATQKATHTLTLTPSPSSSTESLPLCPLPHLPIAPPQFSTLTLDPRARELQDIVVASFLFLERNRRIREAVKNMSVGSSAGGASGTVIGGALVSA